MIMIDGGTYGGIYQNSENESKVFKIGLIEKDFSTYISVSAFEYTIGRYLWGKNLSSFFYSHYGLQVVERKKIEYGFEMTKGIPFLQKYDIENQDPEILCSTILGLCAAVFRIHKSGIAHLDVNHRNFIFFNQKIYLLDFSLSLPNIGYNSFLSQRYNSFYICFYRPPEIWKDVSLQVEDVSGKKHVLHPFGHAEFGMYSDLWALGATILFLIQKEYFFEDKKSIENFFRNREEILFQIVSKFPGNKSFHENLCDFLLLLLSDIPTRKHLSTNPKRFWDHPLFDEIRDEYLFLQKDFSPYVPEISCEEDPWNEKSQKKIEEIVGCSFSNLWINDVFQHNFYRRISLDSFAIFLSKYLKDEDQIYIRYFLDFYLSLYSPLDELYLMFSDFFKLKFRNQDYFNFYDKIFPKYVDFLFVCPPFLLENHKKILNFFEVPRISDSEH